MRAAVAVLALVAGASAFGHYPDSVGWATEWNGASYVNAGSCVSDLGYSDGAEMFDESSNDVNDCWDMCSAAYPDTLHNIQFSCHGDGNTRCYCTCQSSCEICMESIGEYSTFAPSDIDIPGSCCEEGYRYKWTECDGDQITAYELCTSAEPSSCWNIATYTAGCEGEVGDGWEYSEMSACNSDGSVTWTGYGTSDCSGDAEWTEVAEAEDSCSDDRRRLRSTRDQARRAMKKTQK